MPSLLLILCMLATLAAPRPSDLANARAIDEEIGQLKDLPDHLRASSIKRLAEKIGRQPVRYALPLAFNLDVDGREGSDFNTLQVITNTLGNSLMQLPQSDKNHTHNCESLAELIRYEHTIYPSGDPRLKAAGAKLQSNDEVRTASDFHLRDLHGKEWNLKSLRGHIVLLNFWATWCPPCQREQPISMECIARIAAAD